MRVKAASGKDFVCLNLKKCFWGNFSSDYLIVLTKCYARTTSEKINSHRLAEKMDLFRLCSLPVRYAPPVTGHVPLHRKSSWKIWHEHMRETNNMHQLSWGAQTQNTGKFFKVAICC